MSLTHEALAVELAVVNGKIHTMDRSQSVCEALGIRGGRVVAIGKNTDVKPLIGKRTRVVDLSGKTVLPGLIDAHHHYQIASRTLGLMAQCHTPPNETIDDVVRVLRIWAEKNPNEEWIIGQGCLLQDRKLKERRPPTRHDLDKVSTRRPVVLRFGMHVTLLNSKALSVLGVTRDSPTPKGATIEREAATGEPSGVTRDIWNFLPIPTPSRERFVRAMADYVTKHCSANGVTSIHDLPETREAIEIYQDLLEQQVGRLGMRIRSYFEVPNMIQIDALVATGFAKGFGNDYFKLGGIKIFVDGGMTSANALFHEPYIFDQNHYGQLALEPATLQEYVEKAHQAGLQVLMHAAGDRANDLALDAVEAAQRQAPKKDHRHRIEHMGNVNPQMHRLNRARQLGVLPVPNMGFINSWADQLPDLLGPDRTQEGFWGQTLIDNGFPLPGNSDATGTHPENTNPFFCMARAINRRTASGRELSPKERISVTEAIKMYTNYAAYAGFEEAEKGSLEVGKYGDVVVVSSDPWKTDVSEIGNIRAVCTIVGGEVVYNDAGL